jgi:hypothetical protein
LTVWSDCVLISLVRRGRRAGKRESILIQGLAEAGGNGKGERQEERGT